MRIRRENNILTFSLSGELDHHSADEVRRRMDTALLANVCKHVIFDFTGLTFMDSSGIGMLMGRNKSVEILGGKAFIVCNGTVEKLLAMSGVFSHIKKADSVEIIKESLRGEG
ncbi:MAG: STAS domain-containing protein [Ruminococcaceae bacterium]|nr:STAS domain-containing protein [Oscillospiraceae bacterium]